MKQINLILICFLLIPGVNSISEINNPNYVGYAFIGVTAVGLLLAVFVFGLPTLLANPYFYFIMASILLIDYIVYWYRVFG